MSFTKVDYKDQETVITAENMNDIQDAILALEDGLFTMEDDRSGEIISITDAANRGFRSLNIFGKTTQDGTPTPDAPVDLVSVGDGGQVEVKVSRKNLLQVTATSKTVNGLTFTVNADKSITVNGTATIQTVFDVSAYEFPMQSDFILSGCPKGGGGNTYSLVAAYFDAISSAWTNEAYDTGDGLMVAEDATKKMRVSILIRKGIPVSNIVFYPMLRQATITDATYEQHTSQRITSATPNGLPGIPVASGGNYTDANGQQWISDEIDFARGVYVRRVGKEVLDGSVPFAWSTSGAFVLLKADALQINSGNQNTMSGVLCDAYPAKTWVAITALAQDGASLAWSNGLAVHDNNFASADEFNAHLATNPITIHYLLATPTETPLPEEELAAYASLHTYKDHTTVLNDASAHMELEYVMDAKKYIDGLIAGTIVPATVE